MNNNYDPKNRTYHDILTGEDNHIAKLNPALTDHAALVWAKKLEWFDALLLAIIDIEHAKTLDHISCCVSHAINCAAQYRYETRIGAENEPSKQAEMA